MSRRSVVLLFVLALVCSLMVPAAAQEGRRPEDRRRERVETSTERAQDKIHPKMEEQLEEADPTKPLDFIAYVRAGTDLAPYASTWFTRPYVTPGGLTVSVGKATPNGVVKLAGLDGVRLIQPAASIVEPPQPVDPDLEESLNAQLDPQISLDPDASPGPAPEGWFHTTGAIHGSQDAWDKGYTGSGVRYMSNDSGADYCHPDLHGTWAYIDQASSPYFGLPEMFDSYSSYLAARDFYLGESNVAGGLADYADTSTTVFRSPRGPNPNFRATFQPIGAPRQRNYQFPNSSESGNYHFGSHPDKALADVAHILSDAFGDGQAVRGERAGVLVVDENQANVYDTVYVDTDYDFSFSDEQPARLARDFGFGETACLDYDGDGLNDVSGGLVYFISDGQTAVPTLDWLWGIPGSAFGNGNLVAFHVQDFLEAAGTHGQGTTSVAVGQGAVQGNVYTGPGGPPQAEGKGLVVGPGKDVSSTQNGNFYLSPFIEDAYIYAGLGYDATPGTGDDVQIVSNSWGFSAVDNDGFDFFSRLIDQLNRFLGPNTALLFSTGNGAAGYGTVAPPSPPSGIGVGASTLFGSIGFFETIGSADQIVGGDPMSWSNRGPGVRNVVGADIVATGAFGTGDLPLNSVLWGAIATADFGGTSMAAPVAAGNLALMYQAWHERTGSWPSFEEARSLLMGSAKDTDHDVWSQGAGLVDADEGTDAASGAGGLYAEPAEWSVGDYRGTEYPGFAHVIAPGGSDTQSFQLQNHGSAPVEVTLGAETFRQIGSKDYSFVTNPEADDHGLFTTPDYVFRIDGDIPAGTELLQVQVNKPHDQFDPDEDLFEPFSNWRVHLQNWTDLDGDGEFWVDGNGNGKVDEGEMDTGEHIRFTYGYNAGPTQQARIAHLDRIADGLLMSFRHRDKAGVNTTDLTVEASFWQKQDWSWVSVPDAVTVAPGGSSFDATISIPEGTPHGMYEGSITAGYDGGAVILPVTVAVAATGASLSFGDVDQDALYDNGQMFGYTDYLWRAESGDWRFFWTDLSEEGLPGSGSPYLVVDNAWSAEQADIDTIVLGPTEDDFSTGDPAYYGPYTLEEVGRSIYTHIGSGRWRFQTSSGGPREIVAARAREGLHAILLHQVRVDNLLNQNGFAVLAESFRGSAGLVTVDPSEIQADASTTSSAAVTVASDIELAGFQAEAFGLSQPVTTTETVSQDDPNDPSTASFSRTVTVTNAAMIEVSTCCSGAGSDIDLYVYGPDGSLLGASTTPTDQENVQIVLPEDGDYRIDVHGWSVPPGTDQFDLNINVVQGTDISVDAAPADIPAGGSGQIELSWDTTGKGPGTYLGMLVMGPGAAPALFQVPIEITVP